MLFRSAAPRARIAKRAAAPRQAPSTARFYGRKPRQKAAAGAGGGLGAGAKGRQRASACGRGARAWVGGVLGGERNWDLESTPVDWVDNVPIDRMRSMSIPHSWGVAICWMANMDTEDPDARDRAKRVQAQWVWMHDSWRNPYIPQLPVMPEPVLDWGVNDEASVYHPYWRHPFVVTADDDVLISLWHLPDRAMPGVFNFSGVFCGRGRPASWPLKSRRL